MNNSTTANNSQTTANNSTTVNNSFLHAVTTDEYRVTIEDRGTRCLVTTWEFMGGRWVALGPGEWYDPALAWEEFGPWDNSDPDNSQPAGTIYDNPLQVLQDYDTTALDSLTEEQQHYLNTFLDFESFAFTVDSLRNNSLQVTVWDSISWDVLSVCSLGEFVIDTLREARDATA